MTRLRILDRYAVRLAAWPLVATLGVTLVALLLERVLRLLDVLSLSNDRFGFVVELAANLAPHYIGLSLPVAFFVALFIVTARLSDGSEIDAMLATGRSLTSLAIPYIVMGVVLTAFSFALFGFIQPYSRYAYRAVMHSAQNAGWSGELPGGMIVSTGDDFVITADTDQTGGRVLRRLFVRQVLDGQVELITTAGEAEIRVDRGSNTATLVLREGNQLRLGRKGEPALLRFANSSIEVPLGSVAKFLRNRGRDERELTSIEILQEAQKPDPSIPYGALMGEFYGRLARALSLPILPLLAIPLGLAGKRSGRASGAIIAGIILVGFQHFLQFGEGLAEGGTVSPLVAVGLPFLTFAALCIWIFVSSRQRPGDTPISRFAETIDAWIQRAGSALQSFRRVPH